MDTKCRLCKEADETVQHIISACPELAQTAYLKRHDQVAAKIYWQLVRNSNMDVPYECWLLQPEPVIESDEVKILWNFDIETDQEIEARSPDIVIINKKEKTCKIIDIAVPADHNVTKKELEKITKYENLRREVERLWKVRAEIVPVVVGALGTMSRQLRRWLNKLEAENTVWSLQEQALCGTASIVKTHLGHLESR